MPHETWMRRCRSILVGAIVGLTIATTAVGQWQRHALPQLGDTEFTQLVEDEGVVYGGTSGGRVFRSPSDRVDFTDWGQGLPPGPIDRVHMHRRTLYASTDDGLYRRGVNDESWSLIDRSDTIVGVVSMCSRGDSLLVLSLSAGLLATTNRGVTWSSVPTPDSVGVVEDLDTWQGAIYIAANRGVYRSVDGGTTYDDITKDTTISEAAMVYVADDGTIIVGVHISAGGRINAISADGGTTWDRLPVLSRKELRRQSMDDRFGTIILVSANEAAYRSVDRGRYWELVDAGFDPLDIDLHVTCIGNGIIYASARNDEAWTRPADHLLVDADLERDHNAPYTITRTVTGHVISVQGAAHDGAYRAEVYDVLGRLVLTRALHIGRNVIETDHPTFVRVLP